jgi:DNA-directed RNA polymerase specialized sigma24 family protein
LIEHNENSCDKNHPKKPIKKGRQLRKLNQEERYRLILKSAFRARVYGDQARDVANSAWLLSRESKYFCSLKLREAARNLGIWRVAREAELHDGIPDSYWEDMALRTEQRERIEDAIKSAPSAVREACRLVLDEDMDLGDAAEAAGISPSVFSQRLALLGGRRKRRKKSRNIGNDDQPLNYQLRSI